MANKFTSGRALMFHYSHINIPILRASAKIDWQSNNVVYVLSKYEITLAKCSLPNVYCERKNHRKRKYLHLTARLLDVVFLTKSHSRRRGPVAPHLPPTTQARSGAPYLLPHHPGDARHTLTCLPITPTWSCAPSYVSPPPRRGPAPPPAPSLDPDKLRLP
jgi:hypothetical protein